MKILQAVCVKNSSICTKIRTAIIYLFCLRFLRECFPSCDDADDDETKKSLKSLLFFVLLCLPFMSNLFFIPSHAAFLSFLKSKRRAFNRFVSIRWHGVHNVRRLSNPQLPPPSATGTM